MVALGVHPVDPPGEVHQQLRHQPGQEVGVATAVDVPDVQRRPGMHRRVRVAERPLVGRQCAVGVLEPLPAHRQQLVLGERRVDVGQRHGVEGEVPGSEPGVLPRVGHREDVLGVDVEPGGVATVATLGRRWRLRRVAVEPALHVVVVELLAPDHPGERLPGDQARVVVDGGRDHLAVELVGLHATLREHLVEARAERGVGRGRPEADPDHLGLPRRDRQAVPPGDLRADAVRVHRRRACDHMVVDPVLGVRRGVRRAVEPRQVGVVVAEQQVGGRAVRTGVQLPAQLAEPGVTHRDLAGAGGLQRRPLGTDVPGPGVAEPQVGQHVERRGLRSRVGDAHLHEQVVRVVLGMRHLDHPVAVVVERPGVEQLVLGPALVTATVLGHQVAVGELGLRVVVAPPQPGMAGKGVDEPPVVLDVLAVVALRALSGRTSAPSGSGRDRSTPRAPCTAAGRRR